jgi:hypothetical protein
VTRISYVRHSHRLALIAAALLAAACARPGVDEQAFVWNAPLAPGAVVHIRNGAGDVIVHRAAGPAAAVRATTRWHHGRARDVRYVVRQQGNEYYICAMWSNSGTCGAKGYRGRSTGGFLSMFSLFHRTTDAAADFIAELPANVMVDARTGSGSINIDGVSSGVIARSTTGTVNATNVSGPIVLLTTNGNLSLTADSLAPADSVRLSTTNGSIHAELPANTEGSFDLAVTNGVVHTNFPVTANSSGYRPGRHVLGQIGSSTRPIRMRTINGTISVSARGVTASH